MTDTITRAATRDRRFPADMTPYRRKQAERYFSRYPRATRVTFVEGRVDRRYLDDPKPREILHCMATSGRFGKPQKTILGATVARDERLAREASEKARRDAERAAEEAKLAAFRDAIPEHARGCFIVTGLAKYPFGPGAWLREVLHDCGGSFGDVMPTPEAVRRHVEAAMPRHCAVYHPLRTAS